MTGVQVTLFKALQSIKIDDDKATEVVDTLEGFIEMQISQATTPVLAKLDAMDAKLTSINAANGARIDSLASSIASQKWVFSAIVAAVGIIFGLLNFFHFHH